MEYGERVIVRARVVRVTDHGWREEHRYMEAGRFVPRDSGEVFPGNEWPGTSIEVPDRPIDLTRKDAVALRRVEFPEIVDGIVVGSYRAQQGYIEHDPDAGNNWMPAGQINTVRVALPSAGRERIVSCLAEDLLGVGAS